MPAVLEEYPNVQLITIGPVIDLYGKFAALKLDVLMKKYKGRVFSKPVFTALPPFIFSGAEFALIPSRDEPFGLVAVEFGRKGKPTFPKSFHDMISQISEATRESSWDTFLHLSSLSILKC